MPEKVKCPACLDGLIEIRPSTWACALYSRSIYLLMPDDKEKPSRLQCPLCGGSAKVAQARAGAYWLTAPPLYQLASYTWLKELCAQLGIQQ